MPNGYLVPSAGTILPSANKTFEQGFNNLVIKNSKNSTGNVTIAFFRNDTATGESHTMEPGDIYPFNAGQGMFDKFVATCAAGTTAYWMYNP